MRCCCENLLLSAALAPNAEIHVAENGKVALDTVSEPAAGYRFHGHPDAGDEPSGG